MAPVQIIRKFSLVLIFAPGPVVGSSCFIFYRDTALANCADFRVPCLFGGVFQHSDNSVKLISADPESLPVYSFIPVHTGAKNTPLFSDDDNDWCLK